MQDERQYPEAASQSSPSPGTGTLPGNCRQNQSGAATRQLTVNPAIIQLFELLPQAIGANTVPNNPECNCAHVVAHISVIVLAGAT